MPGRVCYFAAAWDLKLKTLKLRHLENKADMYLYDQLSRSQTAFKMCWHWYIISYSNQRHCNDHNYYRLNILEPEGTPLVMALPCRCRYPGRCIIKRHFKISKVVFLNIFTNSYGKQTVRISVLNLILKVYMKVGFNYNCLPEAKKIHLKERLTHFPDLLKWKVFYVTWKVLKSDTII